MAYGNSLKGELSVSDGGTVTLPADSAVVVGAVDASISVALTIDDVTFELDGSPIPSTKCRKVSDFLPQGAVLTLTGGNSKVLYYAPRPI